MPGVPRHAARGDGQVPDDRSCRRGYGAGVAPDGGIWPPQPGMVEAILRWAAQRITNPSDPVPGAKPPDELAAATGPTVIPEGIGWERALTIFTDVLVPATRAQDHPMNLAYVPAAPTEAALAFDLAVSAAEIFGGLWEAGAGAIHAENQALRWICDLLGWGPESGGCFVAGGTAGNLSALVAARHRARSRGLPTGRIAATEDAHSSVRSAATVLDVGITVVPEDERSRLTGAELEKVLDRSGDDTFAVVASAGTTNAGIVDDLRGVAEVCAERGIWLHVDGAYGGAALAAPPARHLFDGIELADSFTVDPHKWLFAPYDCCALVYREAHEAGKAHTQRASYLDGVDHQAWNPADYAVHLTRRARGLPFWFSLATYGTDRYAMAVQRCLDTAREIAARIAGTPGLSLVLEPELSVVLFERDGWGIDEYRAWSGRMARAGVILCLPTQWRGRPVLRLCIVNPETRADVVMEALATLVRD